MIGLYLFILHPRCLEIRLELMMLARRAHNMNWFLWQQDAEPSFHSTRTNRNAFVQRH